MNQELQPFNVPPNFVLLNEVPGEEIAVSYAPSEQIIYLDRNGYDYFFTWEAMFCHIRHIQRKLDPRGGTGIEMLLEVEIRAAKDIREYAEKIEKYLKERK